MKRLITGLVLLLACCLSCSARQADDHLSRRWLLLHINMLVDERLEESLKILERAAAVGYNGVVVDDWKFNILDRMGDHYFNNARRLRDKVRELGMELVVGCMSIGYSGGILVHDPNLAEGMPVRDMPYVVTGGQARPVHDPRLELPGGDFENVENGRFGGWDWYDYPGQSTIPDDQVVHSGKYSVRMERIGEVDPKYGHCRFCKRVSLRPFNYYHISAWIRTEDFAATNNIQIAVLAGEKRRSLAFASVTPKRTQDWQQYHAVFNSLDNEWANIYIGVWQGTTGKIWWDDVRIEECGPVNIVRRAGTPLVIRAEDGTVYEEGVDFERVEDPRLGRFETYHTPPAIIIIPNSRIREGQRLLVSFYAAPVIGNGQVMCCFSEPKVYEILRDQIQRVSELMQPDAYMMNHDEIRCANWDPPCQQRHMTPGELLADNVSKCIRIIRDVAPQAEILVWSDMFDPYHNAGREPYYLVNGSWKGSWEGLDKDVIIVNWYSKPSPDNNKWFADRGHRQILAGYYDTSPADFYTPQWLEKTKDIAGILGVMYTPWSTGYDNIEAWAQAVWGGKKP